MNSRENTEPSLFGIAWLLRSLLTVFFDPALLFQRFLVVSKHGDPSLAVVLSYEPSSHPAAFFEAKEHTSMATKTVIITKTKRTGNVNHIVSFSKETECSCRKGRLFVS
ncbi:hypothetical protein DPMN_129625 [Dreissena polymorpha]|uniref:Uncharacterized protein n=1 Tax=Dreissena polymorpha TaxID=45954 RepID=A0A9D4H530_DREPO|nr:hypothetical protein DPMN_129625 [Dreissena polymorpha]